ncbi:MAG: glycosyl hydrolase family 18 protein [Thermaerobacter sp.]|nr:glycosyl hydrolase family 18 protein [Thermaerobacter sp.]
MILLFPRFLSGPALALAGLLAVSGPALAAPLLSYGDRGTAVATLQRELSALGYAPGPADGVFGPDTLAALERFQAAQGLAVDGVDGPQTSAALRRALDPAPAPPQRLLLGYYAGWAGSGSAASFARHAAQLQQVSPYWFSLAPDGTLVNRGQGEAALVAQAHREHVRVLAMVTNQGGTDRFLRDPADRQRAVANLLAAVRSLGLDGVNVDFEGLGPADRADLTAFVQQLHRLLAARGLSTTVAVGAKTSDHWYLDPPGAAYDYAALAQASDGVVIMAYDQHSPGTAPGPVASLAWVRQGVNYALTRVPANKLILGIADYGYDWSSDGSVHSLSAAQAIALADQEGVPIAWSSAAQEPHFSYTGPRRNLHQVWFEDSWSVAFKLRLFRQAGLAGAGLWHLGGEDPGFFHRLGF